MGRMDRSGRPSRDTPDRLVRTAIGADRDALPGVNTPGFVASIARAGPLLLDDMGELMGQQAGSRRSAGVEPAIAEEDVAAMREGHRAELPAHASGLGAVMNPHAREIAAERAFHPLACARLQLLAVVPAREQPVG